MYWTKNFIPTLKENPQEAESTSHKLLLRAGLARMLMSGVYSYLPLGLKVLNNIEKIIRQEMASCGANELLLPALQPLELWQKTGRDKDLGEVMFKFQDRRNRDICLGPTHEEAITDLVKNHISSYKQLPLILYQIQSKFRDEIRPRFGLIRASEFIMKDAYSFDQDEAGLDKNYQAFFEAYKRIFLRLGLEILITEADSGVMGGKVSHEFMAPSKDGEDIVLLCPKCKAARVFSRPEIENKAGSRIAVQSVDAGKEENFCPKCKISIDKINCIEAGHIFKLGTKYSQAIGANFIDAQGKLKPMIMGCYGIGVSRLIAAVIEQNNDAAGIIWPKEVAPYQIIILPLDAASAGIMPEAERFYKLLCAEGFSVLLDDRDERAGVKFKDADLLGIPLQVVVGKQSLENKVLELKIRSAQVKYIEPSADIFTRIKEFCFD